MHLYRNKHAYKNFFISDETQYHHSLKPCSRKQRKYNHHIKLSSFNTTSTSYRTIGNLNGTNNGVFCSEGNNFYLYRSNSTNITHHNHHYTHFHTKHNKRHAISTTEFEIGKIVNEINASPFLKKTLLKSERNYKLNAINKANLNLILGIANTNINTTHTIKSNRSINNDTNSTTHYNTFLKQSSDISQCLLSKQLSLRFNKKYDDVLKHSQRKLNKYNCFRDKILPVKNEYSVHTININNNYSVNDNDQLIENSKRNFRKFMKVLENKTNEGIKKAKIIEKQFYQAKYDEMNIGNAHKRNKGKRNYMRTLTKLKFNTNRTVNDNYKMKDESNNNSHNHYIHSKTLIRKESDDLLIKDVDKLRDFLYKSNDDIKLRLRNIKPHFLKKTFSRETIRRYREYNGVFFGLPV